MKMNTDLKYGLMLLKLYEEHRDNMHIANVADMLERMEGIYRVWQTEKEVAVRTPKSLRIIEED